MGSRKRLRHRRAGAQRTDLDILAGSQRFYAPIEKTDEGVSPKRRCRLSRTLRCRRGLVDRGIRRARADLAQLVLGESLFDRLLAIKYRVDLSVPRGARIVGVERAIDAAQHDVQRHAGV